MVGRPRLPEGPLKEGILTGVCRINGELCECRVVSCAETGGAGEFWFRPNDRPASMISYDRGGEPRNDAPWDKRKILDAGVDDNGLAIFHCSSSDGTGVVIRPRLTP